MSNAATWAVLAHVNTDGTGHLDTGHDHHEISEPTTHEAMAALVALAKRLAREQDVNILLGGTSPDHPRVGLLITVEGDVSEDPRALLHRSPRPVRLEQSREKKGRGRSRNKPTATPEAKAEHEAPVAQASESESDTSDSRRLSIFESPHSEQVVATPEPKAAVPWRVVTAGLVGATLLAGAGFAAAGSSTTSQPAPQAAPTSVPVPTPSASPATSPAVQRVALQARVVDVGATGTVKIKVRGDIDTVRLLVRHADGRRRERSLLLDDGVGTTRLTLRPGTWTYVATGAGAKPARGKVVVPQRPELTDSPTPTTATPVPATQSAPTPTAPSAPAPPPAKPTSPPKKPKDPQQSPPPGPIG